MNQNNQDNVDSARNPPNPPQVSPPNDHEQPARNPVIPRYRPPSGLIAVPRHSHHPVFLTQRQHLGGSRPTLLASSSLHTPVIASSQPGSWESTLVPTTDSQSHGQEAQIKNRKRPFSLFNSINNLDSDSISIQQPRQFHPVSLPLRDRNMASTPNQQPVSAPSSHLAFNHPQWQPDSEAQLCFVCNKAFNFINRRHHCRKCGRVVCATCSPHRITIPRHYVVQPPNNTASSDDESSTTPQRQQKNQPTSLGSEEVRVCNPCVPDPNPSPPLFNNTSSTALPNLYQQFTPQRTHTRSASAHVNSLLPPQPFGSQYHLNLHQDPHSHLPQHLRSYLLTQPPPGSLALHHSAFSYPLDRHIQNQDAVQGHPVPNYHSLASQISSANQRQAEILLVEQQHRRRLAQSNPTSNNSPRLAQLRDHLARLMPGSNYLSDDYSLDRNVSDDFPLDRNVSDDLYDLPNLGRRISSDYDSDSYTRHFLQQKQPDPDPDEDLCPVCSHLLPPEGPEGESSAREAHIERCINQSLYSSSALATRNTPASSSLSGLQTPAAAALAHTENNRIDDAIFRSSKPVTRIVYYQATEKDCIDGVECMICLENYSPHDELGLLTCFCKYHKGCIDEWSQRKGPVSCPKHMQHD